MYSVVLMMAMTTGGDVADFHRRGGCEGGGCMGYAASCGCTGGRHHLFGGRRHGCTGGGYACYGGGYACYGGGYGGCTGGGGYGGCTGGVPYYGPGGMPYGRPPGEELKKMPKEEPKPKTGMVPAPATLIVALPADAKLFVDDAPTTSTSSERTFVSPELKPGIVYNYTLKLEVVRDGKPVQSEQTVTVRAGETTRVNLLATQVAYR
jgi:uncharacterized protein (TIGR03000 family)